MKKQKKQDNLLTDNTSICQVCYKIDPQEKVKHGNNKSKEAEVQRKKILQLYQCISCKNYLHKHCYDPSLHQPKNFKCDFCKHGAKSKQVKKVCFICLNEGNILKHIEDNKFAHIPCALISDMVVLQNFKTLKFKINPQYKPKEGLNQKQRQRQKRSKQSKQNKEIKQQKCEFCITKSSEAVLKCWKQDCNYFSHLNCCLNDKIRPAKYQSLGQEIIFNLLDKSRGSFRCKNYEFLRKMGSKLQGMELLPRSKRNVQMITCGPHSSQVIWCSVCHEIGDPTNTAQCTRCRRWIHQTCARMKNSSLQSYFQCNACVDSKKYQQRALIPELIYQMLRLQTSTQKWSNDDMKYLDCFAFKCSTQMYGQILKNSEQFQHYHLYQYLEKEILMGYEKQNQSIQKTVQRITTKDYKGFIDKKIIQILNYLKHKQLKKMGELNTVQCINNLRSAYPFKNLKKSVEKAAKQDHLKKILDKILDVYVSNIKQTEIKDVSMKLVQFSDKIRREIVNIKDFNVQSVQNNINKKQTQKQILDLLNKRPHQIALDLRELLNILSRNKHKLAGKVYFQSSSISGNKSDESQQHPVNSINTTKPLQGNSKENQKSSKHNSSLSNNFLMTLIRCIVAKDQGYENQIIQCSDLQDLIDSYRRLMYISHLSNIKPYRKITLPEQYFFKTLNKSYNLSKTIISNQSRIRIHQFFKSLMKQHNIQPLNEVRSQLTQRYDQLLAEDKLNYTQSMKIRQNIAEQGVFVDGNSKLLNCQKRSTYFRVLKMKYMKIVNAEMSETQNQQQPKSLLKINEKNRKDILDNVKRLLEADGKNIKLTEVERRKLEYFLVKQEVFTNILREEPILGAKLDVYVVSGDSIVRKDRNRIELQRNNESQGCESSSQAKLEGQNEGQQPLANKPLSILQRIRRVFAYWMQHGINSPYQIIKVLYPIAQKRIKFPFQYQAAFNQLIESMGTRYNMRLQSNQQISSTSNNSNPPYRIPSEQFSKLFKLITHCQLQNAYPKLRTLHIEYSQWLSQLQSRYNPVGKALQDKFMISQLLQVIENKIIEAQRLQIDLRVEIKKLKLLKLWAVLSEKFMKDFQKKPTISAIQQFKHLMVKISYPKNAIYLKVLELENYGRLLNQRIDKYLKKSSNKGEQMEFYEQIATVDSKMTLRQAEQLKIQLQNSKLDVSAELQTLEDQIAGYMQIPNKLQSILKKSQNLQQLLKIKSNILDASIRYENLDTFCMLVHRISFLKCQTLQSTVTRKQFQRLLNTSDSGVVKLTRKMPLLLKAYREIQRAQRQVLKSKPTYENMLPYDNPKRLRAQLVNDPTTLQQLQKSYQKVQSLRDKFKKFKSSKVQYDKYILIEYQLSHYLFSYKDISTQIAKMKRDLDILIDRAGYLKKNFNPSQANQIVKAYNKQGIKSTDLQQLKKINESYAICMNLSERQEDYGQFSMKCKEYDQLASIIKLNEVRSQLFDEYYEEVMTDEKRFNQQQQQNNSNNTPSNSKQSPSLIPLHRPNIHLIQTLIQQGCFLLNNTIPSSKHYTSHRNKLLQRLLKLNNKIGELMAVNNKSSGSKSNQKQKQRVKTGYRQTNLDRDDNMGDSNQNQEDDEDGFEDDDDSDSLSDDEEGERGYEDDDDQRFDEDDDIDFHSYEDDEDDEDEDSIPKPVHKRTHPLVMQISDQDQERAVIAPPRKISHLNPAQPAIAVDQAGQVILSSSSKQASNIISSSDKQ